MRQAIKPLTRRTNGQSLKAIVERLKPKLQGFYGDFKHVSEGVLREVDGWKRGRLRSILRKKAGLKGRGRGRDHPFGRLKADGNAGTTATSPSTGTSARKKPGARNSSVCVPTPISMTARAMCKATRRYCRPSISAGMSKPSSRGALAARSAFLMSSLTSSSNSATLRPACPQLVAEEAEGNSGGWWIVEPECMLALARILDPSGLTLPKF